MQFTLIQHLGPRNFSVNVHVKVEYNNIFFEELKVEYYVK